jgi:hypothetical protein
LSESPGHRSRQCEHRERSKENAFHFLFLQRLITPTAKVVSAFVRCIQPMNVCYSSNGLSIALENERAARFGAALILTGMRKNYTLATRRRFRCQAMRATPRKRARTLAQRADTNDSERHYEA